MIAQPSASCWPILPAATTKLGLPFIQASIDHFAKQGFKDGVIPVGQSFEFAPSNSKIIAIQEKLGATLGGDADSALLRIDGNGLRAGLFKEPVEVRFVPLADGSIDPNNFVVSWESFDARQKVMASFTKGVSTFKGTPVTQCQFISNGHLPNAGVLENVVAAVVKAAAHEIGERGWKNIGKPQSAFSPSIPVDGTAQEIFAALFDAQNVVLLSPRHTNTALNPAPPMHIHALQEPEIIAALKSVGATQRMLGDNPMQTATLDLRKAAEQHNAPNRPVALITPDMAKNDPLFSLAA